MLLPKKLFVQEDETQLRKQKKLPPEAESVKLHQEKVLEEQLEGEDDRIFFSFFIYIWYELLILKILNS